MDTENGNTAKRNINILRNIFANETVSCFFVRGRELGNGSTPPFHTYFFESKGGEIKIETRRQLCLMFCAVSAEFS